MTENVIYGSKWLICKIYSLVWLYDTETYTLLLERVISSDNSHPFRVLADGSSEMMYTGQQASSALCTHTAPPMTLL